MNKETRNKSAPILNGSKNIRDSNRSEIRFSLWTKNIRNLGEWYVPFANVILLCDISYSSIDDIPISCIFCILDADRNRIENSETHNSFHAF